LLYLFGVVGVFQDRDHNKDGLIVEIKVEVGLDASNQWLGGLVKRIFVFLGGGLQVLEELFGEAMAVVAEEVARLNSGQLAGVADTVKELLIELFEVLVVLIVC